jgi:phosphonate transport system substrate-binding protein
MIDRQRRTTLGLAAALLVFGPFGSPGAFELDPRYTDRDGDLVADTPADPSAWQDPDELIFAYTPAEDPSVYADAWAGFLDHLEAETGRPARYFTVQSNAAQIEAMRAGRLHVAGIATGTVPLAVACAGFRPFAMMAAEDGSFGYQMAIITHAASGIEAIEDLAGRTMAFTSETSNSGFKAPSALLESEFGLVAGEDFRTIFSGAHDSSVLGVFHRDYDAAAIALGVMDRLIARDMVDAEAIRIVYRSAAFPTTAYGVAHDLAPDLQAAIEAAFFSYDWAGTPLLAEFGETDPPQETFVPITFADDWAVIRQIDSAMGVSYTCD